MTQVETNGTAIGAVAGSKTSRTINYEEQKKYDIEKYAEDIYYSERYYDDFNEYRHVFLPSPLRKYLPKPIRLMSEEEWRNLGVQQSVGWEHYMIHV
ncbi:hypothetical protein H4219_006197 [Mycoemilia scoparia]|uniref:Cyclin-dependent kinases regulatory subunit n=1 Tax=Mycoemilia scoparia TaxID=417184 RepID=A0A9W7ZQB8_9FUNG|nr:hypothetical protein H4219_006197 [Mycoemilia scoparia]